MKVKVWIFFVYFVLAGIVFPYSATYLFGQVTEANEFGIVMIESFNNNDNDWPVGEDEEYSSKIENSALTFEHKRDESSFMLWNLTYLDDYNPYVIETKLKHVNGLVEYGFGLIWGVKDLDSFYTFNISDNGYYRIALDKNGEWEDIVAWTESAYVHKNNGTNILKVIKKNNKIAFYINGYFVNQIDNVVLFGHGVGYIIWLNQTIQIEELNIYGQLDYDLLEEDDLWWYFDE
jgi:hypothetical protein